MAGALRPRACGAAGGRSLNLVVRRHLDISPHRLNEHDLRLLGEEACRLVREGRYHDVAERFGYALAYGRDPAAAIKEDVERSVPPGEEYIIDLSNGDPTIKVTFLQQNSASLVAAVECYTRLPHGGVAGVDLVVTEPGGELRLTLEDARRVA
jgi:hypothetical protein